MDTTPSTPDIKVSMERGKIIQSMSPNEVISCLWNKNASEKCKVGLADTIAFERGVPVSWYVTGKTGEVTKKRGTDLEMISQRFVKIASQSSSNIVAILRQENGMTKILPLGAWQTFISQFAPDKSIISLHAFVKGNNNAVYRNRYRLKDKQGRVATSTHSYSMRYNQSDDDSISTMNESEVSFVECRSNQICNVLDLATSTVVRYLEMMMKMRITTLTIDYAIDLKSQIWILWASDTKYTVLFDQITTEDLGLHPSTAKIVHDKEGRMSWAGLKYFETMVEESEKPMEIRSSSMSPRRIMTSSPPKLNSTQLSDSNVAATQLNMAVSVNKTSGDTKRDRSNRTIHESATYSVGVGAVHGTAERAVTPTALMGNYPQPFKCKGDYCTLHVHPVDASLTVAIPHAADHIVEKLFTKTELMQLRKDKQFGQMMSFGSPGPALAAISMKNVILARQERRGLAVNPSSSASFEVYPSSPRSKMTFKEQVELSMKASLDGGQRAGVGEEGDQKTKESILAHDKQVRESFTKSMASYYDQVRVCGVCYNVYNCLDWAREVLGHGDAYGAGLEGRGARSSPSGSRRSRAGRRQLAGDGSASAGDSASDSSSITEMTDLKSQSLNSLQSLKRNLAASNHAAASASNKPRQGITSNTLSKSQPVLLLGSQSPPKQFSSQRSRRPRERNSSPSKDDSEHLVSSPAESSSATLQSASVAPSRATWKDRVTSRSKLEAEQKRNSRAVAAEEKKPMDGAKFVALDDYLRSGADAVAVKKFRQRQQQQENDDDRSVVSGDVYRGKVLFACEDGAFARAALAVLEEAFFAVHWVKDGRQALNDFVLSDNTISSNGVGKNKSNSSDLVSGNSSVANTVLNSVMSSNLADSGFDCVLVQRDLPLCDAFKVTSGIREFEKNQRKQAAAIAAMAGKGTTAPTRRHAVICYTSSTSPEDLKQYMKADMDGCVSHPVNRASLLNTVRAAIPHHLAPIAPDQLSLAESLLSPSLSAASSAGPKVYRLGPVGEMEGSKDSSSTAAKSLPLRTGAGAEEDCAFHGVVQLDADTRIPFTVLDASRSAKGGNLLGNGKKPFFNLVVCQDIFDTSEKLKIFLRPMVQRYIGMQVLLWNYPGQAFTEWRKEQLLNNEYLAGCLNDLLGQVGERGTRDFDTSRPFYLLGYGLGASVGGFYASHYRVPCLRGVISVNGWSFLDSYLAGVMHDCINVFQCAPPTRPDLPVYFFSRFLFSKEYLAKVSVPLALNIYTAIHNAISLEGRLGLCRGVLQAVDLRPVLREMDCPLICIHSTQDALCRPLHAEPFVTSRGGEVRSIFKALQTPAKTCVIWVKAGHEVFQESKKQTQLLVEQILTGFHETHDVSFPAAPAVDPTGAGQGRLVSQNPWSGDAAQQESERTVEDKFIDSVLTSMNRIGGSTAAEKLSSSHKSTDTLPPIHHHHGTAARPRTTKSVSPNRHRGDDSSSLSGAQDAAVHSPGAHSAHFSATDPSAWTQYSQLVVDRQHAAAQASSSERRDRLKSRSHKAARSDDSAAADRVIDPTSALFERQDGRAAHKQAVHDYPEVKEYMAWRLKRNKKRLQRLQAAAKSIQGAFRAHLARKFVHNIRRYKAALLIQRIFRGWLGRCDFVRRTRHQWAAHVIQKLYRGYRARKWYFFVRLHIAAASNIQRMVRAMLARQRVARIRRRRFAAASTIQALLRRYKARRDVWRIRRQSHCAVQVQRTFRGHLGRTRAAAERDKYIFSRSQSQGIEFGRQMLLEHKLHATRLQSDVTLLTQEKIAAEEQVEALLEEISSFEDGVRVLEKEMHQLSKVEAEAAAFMDADSRFELREQKIKLDREFGEMLGKIGNRKELLSDLERKLGTVDKARQGKEEELRTLERKLVVLLEEQQNELSAIKRKQDVRGALLAASHQELVKATSSSSSSASGGGGQVVSAAPKGLPQGTGTGGPSLQEKKQAAQLMQSTETLMKFGFMSMSMTYFSSLNMIKALRTVSAQDTVMAALADVHSQRAVGLPPDSSSSSSSSSSSAGMGKPPFLPLLKKGQLSGQEALRVSAWSVDDVAKWLQTLSLGQYSEAFNDAAIDGEFLFDLNDDDLKNTLGIEHRLHRKKILNCVHRLKLAEAHKDSRLNDLLRETNGLEPPTLAPDLDESQNFPKNPFKPSEGGGGGGRGAAGGESSEDRLIDGPKIPLAELFSLVRHSKFSLLKDALDYLPSKPFDKSLIQAQYAMDHGTIYLPGYERLPFHLNKTDDFGNSLLSYACQNGNAKICKYLIAKGSNMNHQNLAGQTPAHFAIAFKFFDLSTWMFENGADDTIHNKYGLSPYDGLLAEGGDELLSLES